MRKFVTLLILVALIISMAATAQAAPPEDGPPGLERAIAAQEAHNPKLLAIPGVVGTGVGLTSEGIAAVKIFTERKGVAGLPKSLDGVPVEVIVTGKFYARDDPTARQERPVPIGVSTGHPNITAGTIGARVKDADGPNVYALSNNHVYAWQNDAAIGDSALQPGPIDGGIYPADEIGTLWDFEPIEFFDPFNPPPIIPENTIDAAIALSSTDLLGNATLPDGYGVPGVVPVEASINLPVQKYGRTTRLTHGTVSAINVTVDVCYESFGIFCLKQARFKNQITITPGSFSDGGDSGSLIVTDDDNKNPVGLLFAGSTTYTVANPIGPVLDRFNVAIDVEQTPKPDLTLLSTDITFDPASPAAGDTVTITATIHNVGDEAATDVVVRFYDGYPGAGGTQIGTDQMIPSLAADGGTGSASVDWTSVSGDHNIYVAADPDNAIAESNESNNMSFETISVKSVSPTAHVSIDMSKQSFWNRWRVTVTVIIKENNASGLPLEGETIDGQWSGEYGDTVSGKTDKNGEVIFRTRWIRTVGEVIFTVNKVVKNGQEYDLSGEWQDSILGGSS